MYCSGCLSLRGACSNFVQTDLDRPWCVYEASTGLRRSVLWSRAPTALSRDGAVHERWRLACGAACSLMLWLLALAAYTLLFVGGGGYTRHIWQPSAAGLERLLVEPYLTLACDVLWIASTIGVLAAIACATSLSRQLHH